MFTIEALEVNDKTKRIIPAEFNTREEAKNYIIKYQEWLLNNLIGRYMLTVKEVSQ